MNCLKCGRETDQSFCESCRKTMEKYPVKHGTVVILPRERKAKVKQQPVRLSNAALERKIAVQSRYLRRMAIAVVILMVLLVCLSIAAVRLLRSSNARPLGQNYSTVTTPTQEQEEQPDNAD